ncbi:MAG: hypothetical protein EOO52_01765 [Gammaproteobacteria bacterium]|nr:MAG: hypothetical protein EOO52_01765 [Gammaproteobacteria bacterium]
MRKHLNKMKLVLFFGLSALTCAAIGAGPPKSIKVPQSFISTCENKFPESEIIFNFRDAPVEEDQKESIRSLTVSARNSNTVHSGERHVLGLTTSKLSWGLDTSYESLHLSDLNVACARPKIKIELEVIYHKVHIAKELSRNSCEYNFVREHEYKHVKINKENMQKHSKEIVAAFNKRFPNRIIYGPIEKVNKEVQTSMSNAWMPFIKKATAKMEQEGNKRHKAIDSVEEYKKSNTVCSGRIPSIIQASENK